MHRKGFIIRGKQIAKEKAIIARVNSSESFNFCFPVGRISRLTLAAELYCSLGLRVLLKR